MRHLILFALSCCTLHALAGQVEISNATVRQPLPGKTLSAGYFSMKNTGTDPIALIAVSSPQFDSVELHTHQMVDGMMQMAEVDKIAIPPGQSVHLQPGGFHLMLFGPAQVVVRFTNLIMGSKRHPLTVTLLATVLLPAPVCPTRAVTSPAFIFRLKFLRTGERSA